MSEAMDDGGAAGGVGLAAGHQEGGAAAGVGDEVARVDQPVSSGGGESFAERPGRPRRAR